MEKNDIYWMQEAMKEAKKASEEGEIPVGCVVVAENKIITRSYNQTEKLNDVTAHAEILSIGMAAHQLGGKYLTSCAVYVTLEPCLMCAGALFWAQPQKIVWGASDPKRGCLQHGLSIFHPKTEIVQGILKEECSALLSTFFSKLR